MRGYIDSIAFEFDSSILAKLELIGVVTVAKNSLILDNELINDFIEYRATKSHSKQLLELRNLYKYLAIFETQTGLKYKIMQHKRAKNITITFQVLKQYNEISELIRYDLKEFLEHFKEDIRIVRLDIAFDSGEAFNITQIAKNSKRDICKRWNTLYFKKEIKLYRLEFVFSKRYFTGKNPLATIEKAIKNIVKKPFKFEEDFNLIS